MKVLVKEFLRIGKELSRMAAEGLTKLGSKVCSVVADEEQG